MVTTSAFAEYAIVPELAALKVPQGADLATSAGLPVAFGTAHVALAHRAGLQAGQTVLILGAAGGVGMAAVQVRPTMPPPSGQVQGLWLTRGALSWCGGNTDGQGLPPCLER